MTMVASSVPLPAAAGKADPLGIPNLVPLSQSLLPPGLAAAFNIRENTSEDAAGPAEPDAAPAEVSQLRKQQQQHAETAQPSQPASLQQCARAMAQPMQSAPDEAPLRAGTGMQQPGAASMHFDPRMMAGYHFRPSPEQLAYMQGYPPAQPQFCYPPTQRPPNFQEIPAHLQGLDSHPSAIATAGSRVLSQQGYAAPQPPAAGSALPLQHHQQQQVPGQHQGTAAAMAAPLGQQQQPAHHQQQQPAAAPDLLNDGRVAMTKKPRVAWTTDLHKRFVDAVTELGVNTAVPKAIMTKMNVEGLTRENVASHLQKYRLQLKREHD